MKKPIKCKYSSCSVLFSPLRPSMIYCSDKCRELSLYELKKGGRTSNGIVRCENVNCEVFFKKKMYTQRYCSSECRKSDVKVTKSSPLKSVMCNNIACKKMFIPETSGDKFCSESCLEYWSNNPNVQAGKYPQGRFNRKSCNRRSCSKFFIPVNPRQIYCSDSCRGKNSYYKRTYGISEDEYMGMLEAQREMCFICGNCGNIDGDSNSLVVDHCHATGLVRKLLCTRCNLMLGLLQDNSDILDNAADYLELHSFKRGSL